MKPILALSDVDVTTPAGRTLARGVTFTLAPAEIVILKGENGSGKTTLIKTILGFQKLRRGKIEKEFSRDDVSYLPQLGNLGFFLPLTLDDVLNADGQVGAEDAGLLGIASLARPWNTASGGERQKVFLTRLLAHRRRILILDEPFNHLDHAARAILVRSLLSAAAAGTAILLISHTEIPEFANAKTITLRGDA